jgi:type I restriction enzyme S subunit
MVGWFGSNNMARVWDAATDMGFLYAFLATPFGMHQMSKEIYGGVVDHISEAHVKSVLCPKVPLDIQRDIGQLVRYAFKKKDDANDLEDEALADMENAISGGDLEDLADARVARQRLGELRDGKESLISGEALRERLNQLED